MSAREDESNIDINFIEDLESPEVYRQSAGMFAELWGWVEKKVNRTNRLKGWLTVERRDGELISLMHMELSEALKWMRRGNPQSKNVPDITKAEEELADVVIKIMDIAWHYRWNIPKAIFLKMEYNKTLPYRHGAKRL